MMKYFESSGIEYTVKECTAIASCNIDDGSMTRQKALFVSNEENGEKFEFVFFGWDMPEDQETFEDMLKDWEAIESDYEVLETVEF